MDIETIKLRKAVYGSNFAGIAQRWSKELGIDISERKVAAMMAQMKQQRIEQGAEYLIKAIKNENYDLAHNIADGILDSIKDRDNYQWIHDNWETYEKL